MGLSEQTAATRRAALDRFIRWCELNGIASPREITLDALEAYQAALATYRKDNGESLERATQVSRLHPVKAFCKWLVRSRLVEMDVSRDLQLPKLPRRLPRRIPSPEEMRRILSTADGAAPGCIRDRAMMETLYSTALRRMELVRLRMCDVSMETATLTVRAGKGGRDRVVPIGARACAWIDRYQREVRPRLAGGLDRGELFLTDYGEPFRRNRLGDRIRRYVAREGLPGACHVFRHACATHMLENGADIRFIQALLGHSSLSTTQVYTHVTIGKLREVHAATHPSGNARSPAGPQRAGVGGVISLDDSTATRYYRAG
ncbi:MAG TPA: tyrosine-type recombinase/integrase [Usitatibacter sp.]|nr:tyrosine-type recombinase/integrase [Usitatibacter sp.]